MNYYTKRCQYCSKDFQSNNFFVEPCNNSVCKEKHKLKKIQDELQRLKRRRYISIKNLPKGPNGMTAKFDMLTKEVVFKSFHDL